MRAPGWRDALGQRSVDVAAQQWRGAGLDGLAIGGTNLAVPPRHYSHHFSSVISGAESAMAADTGAIITTRKSSVRARFALRVNI
jgi:hypothetical protein